MKSHNSQNGQVLVAILLIMMVGLTIGLFLMSRTTTDISVTTKVSDSSRAFNAAEAGVEEAIRSITSLTFATPYPVASGVTYTVSNSNLGAAPGSIYPAQKMEPTKVSKSFTVWFVPHNDTTGVVLDTSPVYINNSLDICFALNPATPAILPAIGVTLFYRINTAIPTYGSSYNGYDSVVARAAVDHLIPASSAPGPCGVGYNYRAQVNFPVHFNINVNAGFPPTRTYTLIRAAIRALYTDTAIAVIPVGSALPKQGNNIYSVGKAGETSRRINVQEQYTVPAPFLEYAVYSTGNTDLTH